jgi:hypothetical protein
VNRSPPHRHRFAALGLAACWLWCTTPVAASIDWIGDYERGLQQAERQRRPALVVFDAAWCSWCQQYRRGSLADPAVQATIRAHFVPIMVDFDARPDLAARFGVRGLPYTLLLSANGTRLNGFVGILAPADMLATLRAARTGQRADSPVAGPWSTLQPQALTRAEYARLRAAFLAQLDRLYEERGATLLGRFDSGATLKRPSPRTWMYLAEHRLWPERRARAVRAERARLLDPIGGGFFNFLDPAIAAGDYVENSKLLEANAWLTLWFAREHAEGARAGWRYLRDTLWDPRDGGFFQAQVADARYYTLNAAERRGRGAPALDRIKRADTNAQAAWALRALGALWPEEPETGKLARGALEFVLLHLWRDGRLYHAWRDGTLSTPDQPLDWFWLMAAAAELPADALDPRARVHLQAVSRQAGQWLRAQMHADAGEPHTAELISLIAWVGGLRARYPALPPSTREWALRHLRLDGDTAPDDLVLGFRAWEALLAVPAR